MEIILYADFADATVFADSPFMEYYSMNSSFCEIRICSEIRELYFPMQVMMDWVLGRVP
jgi:hypothetical protein